MILPYRQFLTAFVIGILFFTSTAFSQNPPILLSDYGAIPDDEISDTLELQMAFGRLGANDTLRFDVPGTYTFDLTDVTTQNDAVLFIYNKPNVTIEAVPGVILEFVNYDRTIGGWSCAGVRCVPFFIRAWKCDNLTIRGASADDPLQVRFKKTDGGGAFGLPFVQGEITNVQLLNGSGHKVIVTLEVGPDFYLPEGRIVDQIWGAWEFENGQPIDPVNLYNNNNTSIIESESVPTPDVGGPQVVKVLFEGPHALGPEEWNLGNTVILNLGDTSQALISTATGTGLLVQDITVKAWPGKAMMGAFRGGVIDNFDVVPQEPGYLMSSNRDGMSNQDNYDPMIIQNCDMIYTGDDAFAITGGGLALPLGSYNVPTNLIALDRAALNYQGGAFLTQDNVFVCDESYAQSSRAMNQATSNSAPWSFEQQKYELGLRARMAFTGNELLINGSSWNNLVFMNNHVIGCRGVGLRCNLPNTTVLSSVFEDTMKGAIILGGYGRLDGGYPYDAGPTFIYNTFSWIDDCDFINATPLNADRNGAIKACVNIDCPIASHSPFSGNFTYSGDRDVISGSVAITNNRFVGASRGGVFAANVSNLTITGNNFDKVGESNPPLTFHKEARGWPIYILRSATVNTTPNGFNKITNNRTVKIARGDE
jgi:hypothetical protein